MQGKGILPQSTLAHNEGQPPNNLLLVRTTTDLKTTLTGAIIPKGTMDRVIDLHRAGLVIDFKLLTVHILPADSPLIQIVGV